MSSETSTERRAGAASGFQPWHFYIFLSMVAATAAVMLTRETHPAALLLLSGAVLAVGLAGVTLHRALAGFFGGGRERAVVLDQRSREWLEREKALTLRSIKELEFDRAMGKLSAADFQEVGQRLRARALDLMQEIARVEAAPVEPAAPPAPAVTSTRCASCRTSNDVDAKFCKHCGARL